MFGFALQEQGPNREPGLQEFSVRKITARQSPLRSFKAPPKSGGFGFSVRRLRAAVLANQIC